MKNAVKTAFQGLINWSLQLTTMNPAQLPPPYNQRLFLIAERVLGAPIVLKILLAEIKEQTENPTGAAAVALDIATALVCAPKSENSPIVYTWPTSPAPAQHTHQSKRLNLREALSLENERATEIIKKDTSLAETIVRLHRRVEAQSTITVVALPELSSQIPNSEVQQMLNSIAAGAPQNADVPQQPSLDMTQDATSLVDIGVGDADAMQMDFVAGGDDMVGLLDGGGSLNPEDDVFGDLDWNMDGIDMDEGF
jgi:mediator of RNA polymerase II transcription subunit 5